MTKPDKQEAIAEMIYDFVFGWMFWEDENGVEPEIRSKYRRLAQKILNYLEGL